MDDTATTEARAPEPTTEPAGEQEPTTTPEAGLRRSTTNKVIAGVCGGLGERYSIDANIVRVAFVVASALWGLGAAIYLVMWVLVPRRGDAPVESDPAPTSRAARHWLTVALVAGAVAVLILAVAFFAHVDFLARGVGTLWIIFLVVLAIITIMRPSRRLTLRRIFALFFLVVMSVVILAGAALVSFIATTGVPLEGGVGAKTWHPTSLADLEAAYRLEAGNATIDLTGLRTSSPVGVTASVALGQLEVLVPASASVNLRTSIGAGKVNDSTILEPPLATKTHTVPLVSHLVLDLQVGAGQIDIVRVQYVAGLAGQFIQPTP